MSIQTKPGILYKYRNFDPSGHSLRIISHSELWFSCAKSFNDPFDTALTYNFDGLHTELAEKWSLSAVNNSFPMLPKAEKKKLAMQRLAEIRKDPIYIEQRRRDFIEQNYQTFGICSLAGSKDNLLLWSHYADHHRGFCVGLSVPILKNNMFRLVKDRILLDLVPIRYSRDIPNLNFFESMLNLNGLSDIEVFVATKSVHWSYEEEQRLVFWDNVDKAFQIDSAAIQEVILGCRISPANKEIIISLCRKCIPQVPIIQAVKDERTFSLSFERIN